MYPPDKGGREYGSQNQNTQNGAPAGPTESYDTVKKLRCDQLENLYVYKQNQQKLYGFQQSLGSNTGNGSGNGSGSGTGNKKDLQVPSQQQLSSNRQYFCEKINSFYRPESMFTIRQIAGRPGGGCPGPFRGIDDLCRSGYVYEDRPSGRSGPHHTLSPIDVFTLQKQGLMAGGSGSSSKPTLRRRINSAPIANIQRQQLLLNTRSHEQQYQIRQYLSARLGTNSLPQARQGGTDAQRKLRSFQ